MTLEPLWSKIEERTIQTTRECKLWKHTKIVYIRPFAQGGAIIGELSTFLGSVFYASELFSTLYLI